MNILSKFDKQAEKAVKHFKKEISSLRTGRATPALVEDLSVKAYGSTQDLKSLASISVEDAKTLLVEPWDDSVIQDIEKALHDSDLGVNPINDGEKIRLPLPDLTADRRKELINLVKDKAEEARISIRKARENTRNEIDQAEEDGKISEDEKYKKREDLDEKVGDYNDEIDELVKKKTEEIEKV